MRSSAKIYLLLLFLVVPLRLFCISDVDAPAVTSTRTAQPVVIGSSSWTGNRFIGSMDIRGNPYGFELQTNHLPYKKLENVFGAVTVTLPNTEVVTIILNGRFQRIGANGLAQLFIVEDITVTPANGLGSYDIKNKLGARLITALRDAIPQIFQRAGYLSLEGGEMVIKPSQMRVLSLNPNNGVVRSAHQSRMEHRIVFGPPQTEANETQTSRRVVRRPPVQAVVSTSASPNKLPPPPATPVVVQVQQASPANSEPPNMPSSFFGLHMAGASGMGRLAGDVLGSVITGEFLPNREITEAGAFLEADRAIMATSRPGFSPQRFRVNFTNLLVTQRVGHQAEMAYAQLQHARENASVAYEGRVFELLSELDPRTYEVNIQTRTVGAPNRISAIFSSGHVDYVLRVFETERDVRRRAQFDVLKLLNVGYPNSRHNFDALFIEWRNMESANRNKSPGQFVEFLEQRYPVVLAYIASDRRIANAFITQLQKYNPGSNILQEQLGRRIILFTRRNGAHWVMGNEREVFEQYVEMRNNMLPNRSNHSLWSSGSGLTSGMQRRDTNRDWWQNHRFRRDWEELLNHVSEDEFERIDNLIRQNILWGFPPPVEELRSLIKAMSRPNPSFAVHDSVQTIRLGSH